MYATVNHEYFCFAVFSPVALSVNRYRFRLVVLCHSIQFSTRTSRWLANFLPFLSKNKASPSVLSITMFAINRLISYRLDIVFARFAVDK